MCSSPCLDSSEDDSPKVGMKFVGVQESCVRGVFFEGENHTGFRSTGRRIPRTSSATAAAKVLLWLIEGHSSRKRLLAAGPSKLKPPKFGV